MSVAVVIAKYKENISWVEELKYPYIVYDKSKDIPNVGREAESYLRYIIANYDNLPDYVVFLQGNPFDHLLENCSVDYINKSISYVISSNIDFFNFRSIWYENHNTFTRTREAFIKLFNHPLPEYDGFTPGAQFIVSRNSILCRSKLFYETISTVMSTVNNTTVSFNNCLVCPWTIERLWSYIFNKSVASNNIIYQDLL